jgi:hypothetical protein
MFGLSLSWQIIAFQNPKRRDSSCCTNQERFSPALLLSSAPPHTAHTHTHTAHRRAHTACPDTISATHRSSGCVRASLVCQPHTTYRSSRCVCVWSGLLSHRHRQGRGSRGTTAHREFLPPPPPTTRTQRRTLEMDIILTACV